jgi:hypothetical protein
MLARCSFRRSIYCFSYYCFVVIASRRPSRCRLYGFKIRVEDCGSKRRTVVYRAFPFSPCYHHLSSLLVDRSEYHLPTASEPSISSVNTRCPPNHVLHSLSTRLPTRIVTSATPNFKHAVQKHHRSYHGRRSSRGTEERENNCLRFASGESSGRASRTMLCTQHPRFLGVYGLQLFLLYIP